MSSQDSAPSGGGDAFQRALARLDGTGGEAWQPIKKSDHPKRIVIQVLRVEQRTVNTTQGPSSCIVVTGDDPTGHTWDVWAWHTVLHRELVTAAPNPGDVIAVSYNGKITPQGGGNSYESYKVARGDDQAGAAFDWTAYNNGDVNGDGDVYAETPVAASEPETEPPPAAADDIPF